MSHASIVTLSAKDQKRVRALVQEHTVNGAAKLLGLSRGVVTAVAGGLGVRRGSAELVKQALARRNGSDR